jgi:hypothetical protein
MRSHKHFRAAAVRKPAGGGLDDQKNESLVGFYDACFGVGAASPGSGLQ